MTDVTAGQSGGFSFPGFRFGDLAKRGDIALAVGVMAILVVLILPLPAVLLDFSLAISIILSVLILMTSLFIQAPLSSRHSRLSCSSPRCCALRSTSRRRA